MRRRRPTHRRRRSGRLRAVLGLGVLLGFGYTGTFAYWTDHATVQSSTLASGTLNLTVDGAEGNPTPATWSLGATNLVPAESVAAGMTVQNAGTVPFTYTASATAAGDAGLLADMTFRTYVGGGPTNGTSNGLRTGSCAGSLVSTLTLGGTPHAAIPTQSLAVSGSQLICVVATLNANASNDDQGKNATATYEFDAEQVGAP